MNLALILGSSLLAAAEPAWEPVELFDGHVFPAYIVATSTISDVCGELEPDELGDGSALFGVRVRSPRPGASLKVTMLRDRILAPSTFTGILPESGVEYLVRPKLEYK